MKPNMERRLALAAARVHNWLCGMENAELDMPGKALYEIALKISARQMCLHKVVEGSGAVRMRWRPLAALVPSTRPVLMRMLVRGMTARTIRWPAETVFGERRDVTYSCARDLGALCLSYAREQDLSIACAVLHVAGRLRCRHPLLDEGAGFVLDQQSGLGSFGLPLFTVAETESMHLLATRLRYTVDSLGALDSYLRRTALE